MRLRRSAQLLLLIACLCAGALVAAAPTGKRSPVSPLPAAGKKATVLLFVGHDCPISNQYAPEVGRIVREYGPKGVRFYAVYVDPDLSLADARKHAQEFGLPPALVDPQLRLTRHVGATVTPEVAVFAPDGTRRYRGRIDDRFPSLGRRREQVTRRDLRMALDLTLAGKPVTPSTTRAIGCFIPLPSAN